MQPMALIRVALAVLIAIHGVTRIALGIVDDFGVFLQQSGFPMGVVWAWAVTVFELLGAVLLVIKRLVRPVCVLFIVEFILGAALVHWPHGWFVVGAGRNGMEYSALLVVCLVAVFWQQRRS